MARNYQHSVSASAQANAEGREVRHMQTQALWELFRDTGAPEAYLLYRKALQNGAENTQGAESACI